MKPASQDTSKSGHLYKLDIRIRSHILMHMRDRDNSGKSGHLCNQDTYSGP